MALPPISRPIRTVLKWQVITTALVAGIAAWVSGPHGALSAALGGAVNITAGIVFALLLGVNAARGRVRGAHVALVAMFRAEAGKVLAIVSGLWLVLSRYGDIVPAAFFSAFVITVIVFSMAFFVHE
ncbi:MAG: ATP synthase subunit I [Pseudomonadota bacterium]|nr:ATP synthase subunit I [Pseudomonadota bacterium]